MNPFSGTGVALVTPFNSDGSVDFEGLKSLLDYTAQGVDYYVVMGTTGESATISNSEKAEILNFVKTNNAKKLPIVYGIGGNNTLGVAEKIANADLEGVDALLSVSPYYNKPSQAGIVAHFEYLADRSPIPIILYNVPGRTRSNMTAETTITLSQHPNIIGIKEASADADQCKKIIEGMSANFFLTSGEDLMTPELMQMGGIGIISVLANGFPVEFSKIAREALAGNLEESFAITERFKAINPLMYEESNPVGVKEVLRSRGVCGGQVRLPLLEATPDLKRRIRALLD
ncbi:4-hydroxy-tetrahydrodipicolinate synthase [Roseivirga misakiensis]|uniref:4-hydroxy-tetrahydrodipicolinate synthase n=1 Tax=Roseivirga misakiensis TaxID=1563681 RepID=A0A1E5T1J8_9BACT|nr:4-hydroxy-tetrahydrodipicolinate synthase [Roseivirga misakiensis]OEK05253.1 4-hydroxy-tetrahydrodipicolinate synthase [Roseivirga misakiensis]